MNKTELRQLYTQYGLDPPSRQATTEELSTFTTSVVKSNQAQIRQKVQAFVQPNWEVLKEILTCNGDCSESQNTCTDAQASVCYITNQKKVDPR
jgi:hypothetical protein